MYGVKAMCNESIAYNCTTYGLMHYFDFVVSTRRIVIMNTEEKWFAVFHENCNEGGHEFVIAYLTYSEAVTDILDTVKDPDFTFVNLYKGKRSVLDTPLYIR